MKPAISWSPVRFLQTMLETGFPTLSQLLDMAKSFGVGYVELHWAMIPEYDRRSLDQLRKELTSRDLRLGLLTCAPDFTHPDPDERERQLDQMKTYVVAAWVLDAVGVRVTTGCAHEGVSRQQGVDWAVACLSELSEFAFQRGVRLGLENHYKDRLWALPDFAFDPDIFLEVVGRLKGAAVDINFDCANPLMTGKDPVALLEAVIDRVFHIHISDRKTGEYSHRVLGEGDVPISALLRLLAEHRYAGLISLEDGQSYAGDEGTRQSLTLLRQEIDRHWQVSSGTG
ncbi:MAG: sugar phosphate isomerase/epimerase [Armatimonadetes bacterium]|nr:sugar phosphate isomerase/epimerase [Armatimonadota bacterium]MDW8120710.1 sugar phosphate isomerase/epimerase family protein [Armatimonadota bacterium]